MKTRLCVIQGGHFSASKGGAQYQAEVLVNQLVASGDYDVTYITRDTDPEFVPEGYEIETISTPRILRRLGFWLDILDIYRRLKRLQPDVIYQQGLKGHTGIGAIYARRNNAKMVFHIASDFDVIPAKELREMGHAGGSLADKMLGEYGLRRVHAVIAQTTVQDELVAKNYGRHSDVIVRNFHPPAQGSTDQSAEPIRVVWVANFKDVKRPELFVDLAERCSDLSARFVMIGRPGSPEKFSGLHKRINQLDNLDYLGELSQDEVNDQLEMSHLMVNTSLIEGFPNTFIQAWARGLPVVTQGVNTDHLFDDERVGVCAENFETLVTVVRRLVEDDQERTNIGRQAQEYAVENHSLKNVDSIINLLS